MEVSGYEENMYVHRKKFPEDLAILVSTNNAVKPVGRHSIL